MTPKEFFERLEGLEPGVMNVPPVPISIGKHDIMAARLINWLYEQMPDGATQGDVEDALDAAKWWVIFWAAAHSAASKNDQCPECGGFAIYKTDEMGGYRCSDCGANFLATP